MRRLVAIAALALAPGGAVAPAAIPAGPAWQLVYVTGYVYSEYSVQGATRIMLATSRGGEPRELARGTRPEWSPDGVRIAFAAPRGGIEVMRADGSGRRRLTEVGAQPAWSPDGRSLAFSTRGGPGIVPAGGGATRLLGGVGGTEPAWSPDGRRLAYVTLEQGDADIAVVDVDGTGKVVFGDPPVLQPAYDTWEDERPRWSPDGRQIAFTRRYAGSGHPPRFGNVWRSDADGSGAAATSSSSAPATPSATTSSRRGSPTPTS